jgi:hypothetical protein
MLDTIAGVSGELEINDSSCATVDHSASCLTPKLISFAYPEGIAWAPACGKAIAELVLDGESRSVDLTPFDPTRFTPAAQRGGRGRKKNGMNVGEQW